MIYCESAGAAPDQMDDLVVFVSQLRAAGIDASIPSTHIDGNDTNHNRHFDIAPMVTARRAQSSDRLVIVDADKLSDMRLIELRSKYGATRPGCVAFGRFPHKQTEIGVRAKLSYVFGSDPEMISIDDSDRAGACGVPVIGSTENSQPRSDKRRPNLMLFGLDMGNPEATRGLRALASSRGFGVLVMCNGKAKQDWLSVHGQEIPIYHYGELLPAQIAPRVDILVCCESAPLGYRGRTLLASLAARGTALLDATEASTRLILPEVWIRSTRDLIELRDHLQKDIVPSLPEIRRQVVEGSRGGREKNATILRTILGSDALPELNRPAKPGSRKKLIYAPTNGVGLGHAQRTSLIASHHDREIFDPVFAAFPSCINLLSAYGFDCMPLVSRSKLHKAPYANDLLNYSRLRALAQDATGLVFDGGYVFDSIYRTILDHELIGVWIRRGMWQAGQDNSVALDREKVFTRVIIPNEAFEELNDSYSRGDHIRHVGPIVQRMQLNEAARIAFRRSLANRFGRDFRHLVVTMLGGGVAADRSAQTQVVCGAIEQRDDTLNLVVVWPTATVEPVAHQWRNSRIVRSHHASALVAASDLYISAAGYNSFHEALYNRVPTIFIPQMSKIMDDQARRARAAADRGLASIVEAEKLNSLNQAIFEFLERGKGQSLRQCLVDLKLPEPGDVAAAEAIEEIMPCTNHLGAQSLVESATRRRRISTI